MCWHRWTKWEVKAEWEISMRINPLTAAPLSKDEQYRTGTKIEQKRTCEKCGKLQLRMEVTSVAYGNR